MHPPATLRRLQTQTPPGRSGQHGLSLLEMAVVLFLISLMISGTLRGQEMINLGHAGNLARDFEHIPLLLHAYQDKYRAQPGDDRHAATHLSDPAVPPGNGDGVIDGSWHDAGPASESSRAWLHLRLARLADGATDLAAPDYMPMNALGKPLGLQGGTRDPAASPIRDAAGTALPGTYIVCSRGIPGSLVQTLDIKLDDGNPATGSLLATPDSGSAYAPGAAPATLATGTPSDLRPDASYIVCRGV